MQNTLDEEMDKLDEKMAFIQSRVKEATEEKDFDLVLKITKKL